jgi:hypothetical protein
VGTDISNRFGRKPADEKQRHCNGPIAAGTSALTGSWLDAGWGLRLCGKTPVFAPEMAVLALF